MIQLPIDHYSISQSRMYARCPFQYFLRYCEDFIRPPGIALVKGRAVDTSATANHQQKIGSGEDLPEADIVESAVQVFQETIAEEDLLLVGDDKTNKKKVISEGEKSTIRLAKTYRESLAPHIQPAYVQEKIAIRAGSLPVVIGYIDVITRDGAVGDLKTSGKQKTQAEVDADSQLTSYALGYKAREGRNPSNLVFWVAIDTKAGKSNKQLLSTSRTEAQYNSLLATFAAQMQAISAGSFPPCSETAWNCGERWCGYYPCKYRRR